MSRTSKFSIALMLAVGVTSSVINISPASAAGGPPSKYSCNTTAASDSQPSTATCFLPANAYSTLSEGDTNVVPGNDTGSLHVTDVSTPVYTKPATGDPKIGTVSFGGDSDGNYGAGIGINQYVTKQFSFVLTFNDDSTKLVTVNVDKYLKPVKPTVKKSRKLATIIVSEPDIKHGGAVTVFQYGSFKQPGPDGELTMQPGKTYVIHVKRTTIDWAAYRLSDGATAGIGHITGIKLKKSSKTSSHFVIAAKPTTTIAWAV